MKTRRFKFYPALGLFLMIAFFAFTALADTVTEVDEEAPAFSNPAEAQRVEQLSALTAQEPDAEALAAVDAAEQKAEEVESLKAAYDALSADPLATEEAIEAARTAYETALSDYETAQALADEQLAAFAGVSPEEIQAMREEGLGWGQIAHELGIHPGALGLGHTKGVLNRNRTAAMENEGSDLEAATARDLKTGWSKGAGSSASGSQGQGKGKSSESSGQGNSNSNSGGNSGGNGGGNSGGNGGGKGGGNGGGKK
jgi:hypothetical protein